MLDPLVDCRGLQEIVVEALLLAWFQALSIEQHRKYGYFKVTGDLT